MGNSFFDRKPRKDQAWDKIRTCIKGGVTKMYVLISMSNRDGDSMVQEPCHRCSIAARDTRLVDAGLKLFLAEQGDNGGHGKNGHHDQSGNK